MGPLPLFPSMQPCPVADPDFVRAIERELDRYGSAHFVLAIERSTGKMSAVRLSGLAENP